MPDPAEKQNYLNDQLNRLLGILAHQLDRIEANQAVILSALDKIQTPSSETKL